MQSNPVVWFEIYVQDMQRAKKFYEAVLDIKLEMMPAPTPEMKMEMWAFPSDKATAQSSYGACGMLVKMEGFSSGGGGTLIYFGCKDWCCRSFTCCNKGRYCRERKNVYW